MYGADGENVAKSLRDRQRWQRIGGGAWSVGYKRRNVRSLEFPACETDAELTLHNLMQTIPKEQNSLSDHDSVVLQDARCHRLIEVEDFAESPLAMKPQVNPYYGSH